MKSLQPLRATMLSSNETDWRDQVEEGSVCSFCNLENFLERLPLRESNRTDLCAVVKLRNSDACQRELNHA